MRRQDRAAQLRNYLAHRDIACPGCGYNLRGCAESHCPECGHGLDETALRAEPGVHFLDHAGRGAGFGVNLVVGLITAGLLFGGRFRDGVLDTSRLTIGAVVLMLVWFLASMVWGFQLESEERPAQVMPGISWTLLLAWIVLCVFAFVN